jgi:hypothetical protein
VDARARQAARDAADKAAKRAIAKGATLEEAEQIAEAAARDAVRRRGEIETIAADAVTKAAVSAGKTGKAQVLPRWLLVIVGIVLLWLLGKFAAFIAFRAAAPLLWWLHRTGNH